MTCAEWNERIDAWVAGTLTDVDARALEQHAASCGSCGPKLEQVSLVGALPAELAPPPSLRAVTLRAVAQRRAVRRWRRAVTGVAAVAAIAFVFLVTRPATKSASDFPGAGTELLVRARARPELAALDAAEGDVTRAMRDQPADTALAEELARIRRHRDEMQRLVAQVTQ